MAIGIPAGGNLRHLASHLDCKRSLLTLLSATVCRARDEICCGVAADPIRSGDAIGSPYIQSSLGITPRSVYNKLRKHALLARMSSA